ncbi:hypothetical protein HGRIS_012241 [Hohenbuehelia grisea]|uniref:Uncharacterized protein n=1 Tax=Hohenbuehelia grisea TaxID=104357 RepID=A0ABR3IRN6_9AGAR
MGNLWRASPRDIQDYDMHEGDAVSDQTPLVFEQFFGQTQIGTPQTPQATQERSEPSPEGTPPLPELLKRLRRERERLQRQRRWAIGEWTNAQALERFRVLGETFSETKFSKMDPLRFDDVPWPILSREVGVESITWRATEDFFAVARQQMTRRDYRTLVRSSQLRFHPDRWRSRRLLINISDDEERTILQQAANHVFQALDEIWTAMESGG